MPRALLGLGSNLGNRAERILSAVREISRYGTVISRSPLIETDPVDCPGGGPFLNACVGLETLLEPRNLLAAISAIEHAGGRQRSIPNAPRTLDIDLLLFGERTLQEPTLTIPHPRMHERRFVLDPLVTVAPNAIHPVLRSTVRELRHRLICRSAESGTEPFETALARELGGGIRHG